MALSFSNGARVLMHQLVRAHSLDQLDEFTRTYPFPFLIQLAFDRDAENSAGTALRINTTQVRELVEYLDCRVYPLIGQDNVVRVGRGLNNEVVLSSGKVSKLHACFFEKRGAWYIEDCGSSNGTYVREQQLEPKIPHKLKPSANLSFGKEMVCYYLSPMRMHGLICGLASRLGEVG